MYNVIMEATAEHERAEAKKASRAPGPGGMQV